jgi:hypothetical protein
MTNDRSSIAARMYLLWAQSCIPISHSTLLSQTSVGNHGFDPLHSKQVTPEQGSKPVPVRHDTTHIKHSETETLKQNVVRKLKAEIAQSV